MKTFRLLRGSVPLLVLTAIASMVSASPVPMLPAGSVWRYRGDGTDQGTIWREVLFDDSHWNSGLAQLGFGDDDEVTRLTPGITTVYFRSRFEYNIPGVTSLTLRLLRDDGAVVYINGVEVFRSNMPSGPITYATFATASVGGAQESTEFVTAQIDPSVLAPAWNVVAVEVHQVSLSSGDLSFDLELLADYGPEPAVVTVTAPDPEAAELSPLVDAPLNPGVFRIARTGETTEALQVFYRLSGTASNGADYAALSDKAEIPAGASTVDVIVDVIHDLIVEGDETVVMRLLPPVCPMTLPPPPGCYRVGTPDSATVTIRDSSAPNLPPTVRLASPTNGAAFAGPTNIFINAIANDPNGFLTLMTVEFFEGARSLGIRTNYPMLTPANPFMLVWQDVPLGEYTLTAVATDDHGATGTSAPVRITVISRPPPTNQPPRVTITSPSEGAIFIAPPEISIEAVTVDPDGYANTVEFFANDQKIGERAISFVIAPPPGQPIYFQFTWSNPAIGQYRLTARTVDHDAARAESESVNITVRENPPVDAARDDQEYPAVASNGVNFFVVWMDRRNHNYTEGGSDYDIYGARVSPSGEVLDRTGIPICTAPRMQLYPSVAFDGQNYLVVWGDNRDNINGILSNEIYGARVTPSGAVLDPNGFKITHGEVAHQPAVAFNGTEYLVVAYAYGHNGVLGNTVLGVRVRPTGEVRDTEELIIQPSSNYAQPVAVASVAGEWLVVWSSSGSIQGVRVSAAGAVSQPIALLENHYTWTRGLAAAGPNYFLTSVGSRQVASDTYVMDVFGTWISREGQPFRTVTISSNRNYSVGSGSGQPTTYVQDHPTAAAQGTNIVVVWATGSIYTNGGTYYSGSDLRGARVLITGFVSPSFPICTAPQQQTFPSIAFNGQQFLTAWQDARTAPPDEYLPLRQFDIFGARIASSGSVLDPNGFLISTAATNRPPHVQINLPHPGDVFIAPADITLHAYAQDPEDSYYVTVEFFANDRSLGVGTFVPTRCATPYCPYFALTWSNVPPGEYTLQARATDRAGGSAYSEPVTVTVREQTTGDRELHVVGIYSGTVNGGTSRNNEEGRTAIFVDRPGKLVTLFLSAYEPVRWSITASLGTTIEKVYVSGFYPQRFEGLAAGTQVIVVPYTYYVGHTLDSGQFYRAAPKVRRLTGMEIASFHGNYQGLYPSPFVIDAAQDDPRLHSSYPVPTPLSELPDIRFNMSFFTGSGISTRAYTLAGPNDGGDLLPSSDRALPDNAGRYYYSISGNGLRQIDSAGGVRDLPVDPGLPEVSWPMGIAYDSRRERVLLVTLGGEGFLYAYTPTAGRWGVVSSMHDLDLASLVYHPAEDALYGLGVSDPDGDEVILYRLNADSSGPTSTRLPLYPWAVHMSSSELVSVGDYLVVLLKPSLFGDPFDEDAESRMYLIDPRTGQSWLTYRSNLPRAIDSDGDGVPDNADQCPGTPPGAIVDAYGCSADQRDADGDGVPDARDECPNTEGGAVNARGCSLAQVCPCEGPWRNHAEYVTCVIRHAWEFFREGLITADERRNIIRAAIGSTCGRHPDRTEAVCLHLLPLTREECHRDGVQFVLSGDGYGSCVLECSSDLVNWAPVPNTDPTFDGWEICCPVDSSIQARFYRLRITE